MGEVQWVDIFKLGVSPATTEFCEWFHVRIYVYISHRKYQVKSHSSPLFHMLVLLQWLIAITSFVCINSINLPHPDRLVVVAHGFLKLPNFLVLIKQKSISLP